MTWAHPFTIAAVPVALFAAWWIFHRAGAADVPFFANIKRRWADRHGLSNRREDSARRRLRGLCLAAGAIAALLALARPQWGEIAERSYDQSREVMLALDLSRSMLADDVAPNRLARAKLLISSLLDQLAGERVGLVVFSGTAFVQSPLSADYEVLRDFLDELEPGYLPEGGTDYAAMLRTAVQAFGQQGAGDRYLVVLSDGEALDPNWRDLVGDVRAQGIRVIGLGVGTPAGALVPDTNGGLIKDERGAAVLSRLEPRTLQELATETGGVYRDAATWVDIADLVNATVEQGRRGTYVEERTVRLQDRFQWFLFPALLLFLLSYWLDFPVSPLARALPTRGRRPHPASASVIAAAFLGLAAWQIPSLAIAAVSDDLPPPSGTASQPNQLTATVEALSNQPVVTPTDYARLATDTIAFASQPDAPTDRSRSAVIDDALAAVDRGEASDARAADWPALRERLEQLKQIPEPPPQEQSQPQQNQQPQQQENGQQDQSGDNAAGSSAEQQGDKADAQQSPGTAGGSPADAQGSDSGEQQEADAQQNDGQQADSASQPSGQGDQQAGADDQAAFAPQDSAEQRAGRPRSQEEVQPLDAPEAGLAGAEQKEAPPNTRMVGGGRAMDDATAHADSALAGVLGDMERVEDGDSPAVLFDRMNRAEGQPRARKSGKNW
jgi:Ca-activated chloride channel family protein